MKHPWFKCIQDKKDRKIKKTAMKENLMNAIIY